MIIGPKYKICRRLGSRVFGKCQTTKFSISGTETRGKKEGGRRPKALSEYGQQLLEKQKARFTYLLKEHQLANYVDKVRQHHARGETPTGTLFQFLEKRLDNVVFRLGLAPSRAAARQMVTHGHIVVNGRRLNIASHQVAIGDRVAVRPESRRLPLFKTAEVEADGPEKPGRAVPVWLKYEELKKEGEVVGRPLLGESEADINFSSILEFYSRV